MTLAQEIVEDAAALILVDIESIALGSPESALLTRILNDYCAELFDLGIDFGYRPVSNPSDPITSPSSVNAALKYNLAKRANSVFGLPLPQAVFLEANRTERRLKANFIRRPRSRLPSNLPMGSGHINSIHTFDSFYSFSLPQGFLRLDTDSTVTITTIDTPVQVGGWTVDRSINVTALADGSIEFISEGPYLALLEANFTVNIADNDQFTFHFAKNGAILEQSSLAFDADRVQNINLKWSETIRKGDKITILVENNLGTADLTLTNGHFRIV